MAAGRAQPLRTGSLSALRATLGWHLRGACGVLSQRRRAEAQQLSQQRARATIRAEQRRSCALWRAQAPPLPRQRSRDRHAILTRVLLRNAAVNFEYINGSSQLPTMMMMHLSPPGAAGCVNVCRHLSAELV